MTSAAGCRGAAGASRRLPLPWPHRAGGGSASARPAPSRSSRIESARPRVRIWKRAFCGVRRDPTPADRAAALSSPVRRMPVTGRAVDLERAAPDAVAARIVDRAEDLRRRLERDLQRALLAQRRGEIAASSGSPRRCAPRRCGRSARCRRRSKCELAAIGRPAGACPCATVERRSRAGCAGPRSRTSAGRAARRTRRRSRVRGANTAARPPGCATDDMRRGRQARLREVVVAAGDEADLEAVLQVPVGEPLEAAVHRVELDQSLELGDRSGSSRRRCARAESPAPPRAGSAREGRGRDRAGGSRSARATRSLSDRGRRRCDGRRDWGTRSTRSRGCRRTTPARV